ncbi:hypothetical protein FQR65_LT02706 [Abscondita terminalis]|nr:hypothetical protein FQR65_LT02706 [Abscondita terminalis]
MDSRCRLCAEVYEELIEILNEADLCTKIRKFFHVDIVFNDKLPTTVCYKCYEITNTTWNFNEQVQKAQEFLAQEYVTKPHLALTNDDVSARDEDLVDRRETVFVSNNCDNFMKDETLTMDTENERETTPKQCDGSPNNEFCNDCSDTEKNAMETNSESEDDLNLKPFEVDGSNLEVQDMFVNEFQNDDVDAGVKTVPEQIGRKKTETGNKNKPRGIFKIVALKI